MRGGVQVSQKHSVMPVYAPLYQLPPFEYFNIRRLSIVYETDLENIRRVVPPPLQPNGQMVVIWVENRLSQRGQVVNARGELETTSSFEVSVDVPVRHGDQQGVTWAFMYVPPTPGDGDARMAVGRELQGAPKKQAYISLREELLDERIHANVSRLGVDIVRAVCRLTGKSVQLPNLNTIMTVKTIPSMDRATQDVEKVITILWERNVITSKGGEVEQLELGRSEADPLYWLKPNRVHGCVFEIYEGKVQRQP